VDSDPGGPKTYGSGGSGSGSGTLVVRARNIIRTIYSFSNAHELFKVSYKATRNGKISLDQLTIEMKEPRTNFRSLLNPHCPAQWQEALLQVWLREEPHQGPAAGDRPPPHQGSSAGVWLEAQATAVPFKFMRVDYSPQTKILPCSVYQAVYIVPITFLSHCNFNTVVQVI
jgi:hypothetical protein